jgi:hypothetical protein
MKHASFHLALYLALPLGLVSARLAHADQCASLGEHAMAARAAALVRAHPSVVSYCEPCGERVPGAPQEVRRVEVARSGDGWSVAIDRREVDLAYTFVRTATDRYQNLAALVGCPAQDVSDHLDVSDATSSGVLITAPAASTAPMRALERPPLVEPPLVAVIAVPTREGGGALPWIEGLMFLLGASASGVTCGALLRHRRRARHVPRAVALMASRSAARGDGEPADRA